MKGEGENVKVSPADKDLGRWVLWEQHRYLREKEADKRPYNILYERPWRLQPQRDTYQLLSSL